MEALKRISQFESNLLKAFEYMIVGRMITISDELRATVRGSDIGMQFMITSINEDETVNLLGRVNVCWKFENVRLKDVIFK